MLLIQRLHTAHLARDLSGLFDRMVSDCIPHGTIPRILPILIGGYQQSLQCDPTRSGKSVGLNLPYDKSYFTEHRDSSLSEPHPTLTAAAGLTKPSIGNVLHAAQQVVRGELNVCLVSWQHIVPKVCAARLPNRGNCSGPSDRLLHSRRMQWRKWHVQQVTGVATRIVHNCVRHNVRVQCTVDARVPRILHLSQSGNRRAFDCQTLENSVQRATSDVTLNGKRGVSVHNVEIPQSSYWGRHMNSGTHFRIHYKSWIIPIYH